MGVKPYPTYRDSGVEWIGEIPEHWEVKRIKNLVRESFGSVKCGPFGSDLKNHEMTSEGIPVFNQRVVIDNNFSDFQYNISDAKFESMRPFESFPGDILITTRGTIGKVCTVPNNAPRGILHPCVMRLQIDPRRVDGGWFVTVLRDENVFKSQLLVMSNATTIEVIYQNNLVSVFLPSPPLEEQKQIASFLDRETSKIDTLIEKQQQLINLLKEKRGSLISHTVTKGLNPNVPMKDSGVEWIRDIPEHWEVKRLGRSCVVSPKRNKSLLSNLEQLVSFLPMNAFNNDGTADYSNEVLLESVVNGYTYMEFGDIAISKVTPCFENGKAARLKNMPTKVGFGTTEITVIRPLRMFGDYVFYIFRVPDVVDIGVSWMYGVGGLQRIPDSFFEQLVTPFPPLEEQKQIASFLDHETSKIDTLIEKANQSITLLKERRSSLISAAVTGKIDVRGVA